MGNIKQFHIDERVYTGEQAFTTQPFTEANVKNGSQFYISEVFSVVQAGSKYIIFTTGDADTIVKLRNISTNGGLEYTVFRNPTISSNGAAVTIHNLNDKNPNPNIVNVFEDPTVTNEGDQWDILKAFNQQGNQSGGGVFGSAGIERILAKNSTYLVKFDNTDNSTIDIQYIVSWYEGPLSVDII